MKRIVALPLLAALSQAACPQLLPECPLPKDFAICWIQDAAATRVQATGVIPLGRAVTLSVYHGNSIESQTVIGDRVTPDGKEVEFSAEVSVPASTPLGDVRLLVDGLVQECVDREDCGCLPREFKFSREGDGGKGLPIEECSD